MEQLVSEHGPRALGSVERCSRWLAQQMSETIFMETLSLWIGVALTSSAQTLRHTDTDTQAAATTQHTQTQTHQQHEQHSTQTHLYSWPAVDGTTL